MSDKNADISRQSGEMDEPIDRLKAARLGAFFRPSQLQEAGLTPDYLGSLIRRGVVEPVGRGVYRLTDEEPTEHYTLAMVAARVPESVFCLLTALAIHGIGTQAPADVWLAIPHKARIPKIAHVRLRIVRFTGRAWTMGVTTTEFEGVPARVTSPARTIVDCFRFERLMGPEASMEALVDGIRNRVATISELARMEAIFPSRRLRAALDVRSI